MKNMCNYYSDMFYLFSSPSDSFAKESREQLLESALLNRYYSVIRQVTKDQYECDSVINIKASRQER